MHRVAVIGLDSFEPHLADRLMRAGKLPNLKRLRRRSTVVPLHSEATWKTGRVWETFLTGRADFPSAILFEPKTYATRQLGSRHKPPFFDELERPVIALDVPYISLTDPQPGARVIWAGHDTGHPRASRPQGLLTEIDKTFGTHPGFLNGFNCPWHDKSAIESLTGALLDGGRKRIEIAKWLMARQPDWQLFVTVLSEAHCAGEMFWHGEAKGHLLARTPTARTARRALHRVYRMLDDCVGSLIDAVPDDTTIVVTSVHGMQANDYDVPSMVLLPDLLYRDSFGHGLVPSLPIPKGRVRLPMPWQRWYEGMQEGFAPDAETLAELQLPERARRQKSKAPTRPMDALHVPTPPEQTDIVSEPILSTLDWQPAAWYREHWPKMRAFALPVFYDARIRVNLKGRERDGVVQDYEAELTRLEALLRACVNPRDGGEAVASVTRMRTDPFDPHGPDADLLVLWKSGVDVLEHPELGVIGPVPYRRTGGHSSRGFAYFHGEGFAAEVRAPRSALDLTPTLRDMLGLPATHPMDGEVLPRRTLQSAPG